VLNFLQFLLKKRALLQISYHFLRIFANFLPIFSCLFYPNPTNQLCRHHFSLKNNDYPQNPTKKTSQNQIFRQFLSARSIHKPR